MPRVLGFSILIKVQGAHLRAARALLGWSQEDLARKARVSARTVKRMEGFAGRVGARFDTLSSIVAVLERAGVEFLDEGQPGVRLKAKPPAAPDRGKKPRR